MWKSIIQNDIPGLKQSSENLGVKGDHTLCSSVHVCNFSYEIYTTDRVPIKAGLGQL